MNKLFKCLSTAVLGIAMAVGVGVGVASSKGVGEVEALDGSYTLVTDASSLKSGDKLVLGCAAKKKAAGAMGTTAYLSSVDATVTNGTLTSENAIEITLGGSSGAWTLTTTEGQITTSAAKAFKLDSGTQKTCTIAITEAGVATITFGSYGSVQYNSTNPRFLNYTSAQTAIEIYRKGSAAPFGVLDKIEIKNPSSKLSFSVGETFSSSGLTLTATDTDGNTKTVSSGFVTNYDNHVFTTSDIGEKTVTVSYTEGSVTKSTTYSILVLESPIYSSSMSTWTQGDSWTTNKYESDKIRKASDNKAWRLSLSGYYSGNYIFGEYNQNNGAWSTFSANKYYKKIASKITEAKYAYAMYSQNFAISGIKKATFKWKTYNTSTGTQKAYILGSKDGGYTFTKLKEQDFSGKSNGTLCTFDWTNTSEYAATDNVIICFAYTSSTQYPEWENFDVELFGQSLQNANWAVQEVSSISGPSSVEVDSSINLTASAVTTGYETPANTNITWSVADGTGSATINSSTGQLTGVSEGTVTVTAAAADGYGASNSKQITITEKTPILGSITLNYSNEHADVTFERKSTFNHDGLVVTAHYSNGFDDKTVTPTSVSTPDMTTTGNKTVTVSYTENGITKTSTYLINVTPIVSTTIELSGDLITKTDSGYAMTCSPNVSYEVTVTINGDETVTTTNTNENIYYEDGYVCVDSDDNDTGSITFKANDNVQTLLAVTVVADESLSVVKPAGKTISGIVNQEVDIEFSLINATSASWTVGETSTYYAISGSGDVDGYTGKLTIKGVCSNVSVPVSVTTSKGTLIESITLSAVADTILSISATDTYGEYVDGDEFDPEFVEVIAERQSGVPLTLTSDQYTLSNVPTGKLNKGTYNIGVTLNKTEITTTLVVNVGMPTGLKIATKTVEDIPGVTKFTKITSATELTDGEYLIGYVISENTVRVFNGVDGANEYSEETLDGDVIKYNDEAPQVSVEIKAISGGYSIKILSGEKSGNYISGKSGSNTIVYGAQAVANEITFNENKSVTILSNSTSFRYNAASGNDRFRYYKTSTTGASYITPYLFKKSTTPSDQKITYGYEDMNERIFDFIKATYNNSSYYTCDDDGVKSNLNNWNNIAQSAAFLALTADDKDILKHAITTEIDEKTGETYTSCQYIIDFISQYDYVVGKYKGQCDDYLERNPVSLSGSNPLISINNIQDTVWIVVIVGLVGLTAVGGYFFIRRRKENH